MAQNFSDSVATAIQRAFALAEEKKQTEVTENHLLLALLEEPEGYFAALLKELGGGSSNSDPLGYQGCGPAS